MSGRSEVCRLCGASSVRVAEYDITKLGGYWASAPGPLPSVQIRRCRRFGSYFTSSLPSPELLEGQYRVDWDEYYARRDYSPERKAKRCRSQLARFVPRASRVLDVGGGNGAFSLAAAADYDSWFQELDPDQSERLREGGVTFLRSVDEAPAGTFDAVTLWDVYEHVWPHAPFLQPIRRALAPDGLLLVEVPTPSRLVPMQRLLGRWPGSPRREASLAQICDFSHLQLMTPSELMHSLRSHGFDVVHHELLSELSYAGVVYARRVVPSGLIAECVGAAFDWRPLRRMVLGNNKVFVVARKLA